jgi:hypothetical protein
MEYFFSRDPISLILQVCQESRSEALSLYTKAFAAGTSPRSIWTNFNADTIKIDDFRLVKVEAEEAALIRWLVVESSEAELFDWYYIMDFSAMKALSELLISSSEEVGEWGGTLGWMRKNFEGWFGGVEGWVCPEMRIVEKETGVEMNLQNFRSIIERKREQWRQRGEGRVTGQGRGSGGGNDSVSR